MTAPPTLDDLADAAGVSRSYIDAHGEEVAVSDQSVREILAAMGLPAWDGDDVAASFQRVQDQPWQRLVPPVTVALAAEQPLDIPINVPESLVDHRLSWQVVAEDGRVAAWGEAEAAALPVTMTRTVQGEAIRACQLRLPTHLPLGYHTLTARLGQDRPAREVSVIIAPQRGWLPEDAGAGRYSWGFVTQLYSLWTESSWGIGDFGDLGKLLDYAGAAGAAMVGLNPLHAQFPADHNHISPYSPSSRLFLNALYIDIEQVAEFGSCPTARTLVADDEFQARLRAVQGSELVDYPGVYKVKLPVLEALFQTFRNTHLGDDASPRGRAFEAYCQEMGQHLTDFATFHALHEHYFGQDPFKWDWRSWATEHQDPRSDAVRQFREDHRDRVLFYSYIHWLADLQLAHAQQRGRDAGMPLGVYRDLAVGAEIGAAEAWAQPEIYTTAAVVGAPPDLLGPKGQNWGLSPMSPTALTQKAYAPFVRLLRANMRHAGALRVDHAMSLMRLFWIPLGREAKDGAYVQYPFQDLVRVAALESWRSQCVLVGEDLGTVPEGFPPVARAAGIQSCVVLWFETDSDLNFHPPESYPTNAVATATTHDLPPVAAWWEGYDIAIRRQYDLYPDPAMYDRDAANREIERRNLMRAMAAADALPAGWDPDMAALPDELPPELMVAMHRFLAHTPCRSVLVQLEDANLQKAPINVPGTNEDPPNWRRRHARALDQLFAEPWMGELTATFNQVRPRPGAGDAS